MDGTTFCVALVAVCCIAICAILESQWAEEFNAREK